jgi:hypothetical protein
MAWWDAENRTVRCDDCGPPPAETGDTGVGDDRETSPLSSEGASLAAAVETGVAGGSADREYERRRNSRDSAIRSRHPRLGGLILALTEDPQSTRAWAKGAEGERRVGAALDALDSAGVIALHDRRIPGSRANIDHIAVGPAGVWVIDAKRYKGVVARKDVGGWFKTDVRLFVGRRDCSRLVTAMAKQVDTVRTALGAKFAPVAVRSVLCFVDAEWRLFAKPFELQGVTIAGPNATARLVSSGDTHQPEDITRIAEHLARRLPNA